MKYISTLIVVKDIEKSKAFYQDVLGLEIISDFGANVTMTGGIALQTLDTWQTFIHKDEPAIVFGSNAAEIYFEEDHIDDFIERLEAMAHIEYVHPLIEHAWGQRVVRFYDLDHHMIEVGENMLFVIKRFINAGLSIEETASRMDVPVDYIINTLDTEIK
jgi:catechol 2,3-dioxygenase-like lactoylglutathione lyase family enzyme